MPLDDSVQFLEGVGPKKAALFNRLGIKTVWDLLYYFPYRFQDRREVSSINNIQEGNYYTLKVNIIKITEKKLYFNSAYKGPQIFLLRVSDGTGELDCIWFNQPYLKNYFKIGGRIFLYGRINRYKNRLQMNQAEYELLEENTQDSLSSEKIVPIYSLTEGFTQRFFRKMMKFCLKQHLGEAKDNLPYTLRKKYNLVNIASALINMHFPEGFGLLEEAKRRISFEEFFFFEIVLLLRKIKKRSSKGVVFSIDDGTLNAFIDSLGFRLTDSQKKALLGIRNDLARPYMMYRLLQGDVGCGKTVVAVVSSLIVANAGYQVAFMVPTEILARQHFATINSQFQAVKSKIKRIRIALLTSATDKQQKQDIYKEVKEGKINLLIGTHALIEEKLEFKNLGLAIIDEQHKFGVGQRALLPKKGSNPDILVMTATPIPRTLAMTIYGDMDITTITQLPSGRIPIKTILFREDQRGQAYRFIKEQVQIGRQAYIVYPIIEESDRLDLLAAQEMFESLKKNIFNEFKLGLIHGRLKEKQQEKVMRDFQQHKVDILVATSVLEVGIDIPNATVMLIEHADHFGLSQLHQLRGRVGRDKYQSYCILIADTKTEDAQVRLKAMLDTLDGFKIAEEDLKIRGPGKLFGEEQHGQFGFLVSDPFKNLDLLQLAREEAKNILKLDANLSGFRNSGIRDALKSRYNPSVLSQAD